MAPLITTYETVTHHLRMVKVRIRLEEVSLKSLDTMVEQMLTLHMQLKYYGHTHVR